MIPISLEFKSENDIIALGTGSPKSLLEETAEMLSDAKLTISELTKELSQTHDLLFQTEQQREHLERSKAKEINSWQVASKEAISAIQLLESTCFGNLRRHSSLEKKTNPEHLKRLSRLVKDVLIHKINKLHEEREEAMTRLIGCEGNLTRLQSNLVIERTKSAKIYRLEIENQSLYEQVRKLNHELSCIRDGAEAAEKCRRDDQAEVLCIFEETKANIRKSREKYQQSVSEIKLKANSEVGNHQAMVERLECANKSLETQVKTQEREMEEIVKQLASCKSDCAKAWDRINSLEESNHTLSLAKDRAEEVAKLAENRLRLSQSHHALLAQVQRSVEKIWKSDHEQKNEIG